MFPHKQILKHYDLRCICWLLRYLKRMFKTHVYRSTGCPRKFQTVFHFKCLNGVLYLVHFSSVNRESYSVPVENTRLLTGKARVEPLKMSRGSPANLGMWVESLRSDPLRKRKACWGKLRAVGCCVDMLFKEGEVPEVGLMLVPELGF